MKRFIALTVLALVLSVPALAGDILMPGFDPTNPPTCTQNCLMATPTFWTVIDHSFSLDGWLLLAARI